ncbi:MAG: hypothetical protein CMM99_02485 [Rickettsiales bacterium]|nr:hypothetical protein [Rickettsiales bacterium]
MKLNFYITLPSILLSFLIIFFLKIETYSKNLSNDNKLDLENLNEQCDNALEWYDDHPGYKGEFVRVLDYCIKYAKDISPEGFDVNPILSDFGSINGVNTRPRDNIHQGIDIIGPKNQPIIAIADGRVLETTIEDCWGGTIIIDHGKSFD